MAKKDTFPVVYDKSTYDIYTFLNNHPGGINYVSPLKNKDIQNRMKDTYHSKAAYYLLREYQDGGRDTAPRNDNDKDLEDLIDWDKPILSQVPHLGPKYTDWVNLPVDRPIRLFANDFLESLTKCPWYVVPIFWIPVIIFFTIYGTKRYIQLTNDPNYVLSSVLNIAFGVVLWTIIEYSLHRWVFHMKLSGYSKVMIFFHFAIHGLHHKVPFDSSRLVFPPVPAAIITYILYSMLAVFLPEARTLQILAGGLLGYLIYDMMHFYLHYGSPSEQTFLYNLKRYHNQHHFSNHESGFGISSTFWDRVFGTAINLRKLGMAIKWS